MSQTEQVSRLDQHYKGVKGVLQSLQSEASVSALVTLLFDLLARRASWATNATSTADKPCK